MQLLVMTSGIGEIENVVDDGRIHFYQAGSILYRDDFGGGHHRLEVVKGASAGLGGQDALLGGAAGIAQGHAEEEAVELVFGKVIGSFEFERILGGDHHERAFE